YFLAKLLRILSGARSGSNHSHIGARLRCHGLLARNIALKEVPDRRIVRCSIPACPAGDDVVPLRINVLPASESWHIGDALPSRPGKVDCIGETRTTDHVAALPVIGIRIKCIVGGIFEYLLQALTRYQRAADLRKSSRGQVVNVLYR